MRTTNAAIAFLAFFLCCATAEAEVTFNWATVGNPGNGPDDTGIRRGQLPLPHQPV